MGEIIFKKKHYFCAIKGVLESLRWLWRKMKKTLTAAAIMLALGSYLANPAKADEKPKLEVRVEDQFSDSLNTKGIINNSNLSWLQLKYPNLVFGFRDTTLWKDKEQVSSKSDIGVNASFLDDLLNLTLLTNLNLADEPNFNQAQKVNGKVHYQPITAGITFGENDIERLVIPYGMIDIKGHKFALSYSDYEKEKFGYQRLNWMAVFDFKKFALAGGTSGIDNNENYVAAGRIENILGMGIQTHAFFNENGIYKYVLFTSRDKFKTSKLAELIMPIFTDVYGTNKIIAEPNLLFPDLPRIDEALSDPNDYGFSLVLQPNQSISADISYRGPSLRGFSPIIGAGYSGTFAE